MLSKYRYILSALIVVALTVVLSANARAQGASKGQSTASHSLTPIIGTLPNGMRYYIQVNKNPSKRAFLWLAVNAGSIQEDKDQLGFAHFLEHMAFNGTKNFPGNRLIDFIEKSGMSFGADLNAYTSFDETVYQLSIPTDDKAIFSQGMQVVQDWASGGILSDSAEVVAERGVVLGEWRARLADTTGARVQKESLERIFGKGSRYVDRLPIGDPKLLAAATRGPIERFYRDWYRPDLMAIIAVGDFDPVQMEADIKARFGPIAAVSNPRKFERPKIDVKANTEVQLVKENVSPAINFSWPVPSTSDNDKEVMKQVIVEQITLPYINRLLTTMSKSEHRPFIVAQIARGAQFRAVGDRYTLNLVAQQDSIVHGFKAVMMELQRLSINGISESELKHEKASVLRRYEQFADGSSFIHSRTFAQRFVNHYFNGRANLWTPNEALSLAREALASIRNEDIKKFVSLWRNEKGRIVTVNIPRFSTLRFLEESNVVGMLDSVSTMKLAAESPYVKQGKSSRLALAASVKPGSITTVDPIEGTDIKRFTLSNGATVVVKPTTANPDEVIIQAYSQGGHSLLADSFYYAPARLVAMLMTSAGGLAGKSHDNLVSELSTTGLREFRVDINAFEEEMLVRGSPRELELLFQLVHLQFTNPTVDTSALEEWRRTGERTMRMSGNDRMIAGAHRRLASPQMVNVRFIDLDQAMKVYKDRFGDASDFTFFIVGAVDEKTIRPLLERYIANLPSTNRKIREVPRSFGVKNPTEKAVNSIEHPRQSAERGQMVLVFRGDVPGKSSEEKRVEQLKARELSTILGRRLRNKLREEMAVTYSVGSPIYFHRVPESRYIMQIGLVTAPDVIDTSVKVLWNEIERLYTEGPSEDELNIARTILTRRLENASQSNSWWISQLIEAENSGLPLETFKSLSVPAFTSDDVRNAAVKYMPKGIYTQQTIKPTKETLKKAKEDEEKKKSEVGKDTTDESKKKDGA